MLPGWSPVRGKFSHVLQTQQTGSVSQVESRSKLARERESRLGGVLGWQSRSVWLQAGNPEQQRRKGRQQLFSLEGRPPSSAGAPLSRSYSWLKALRSNRTSPGGEVRFGSELTVNSRRAPCARRFSPCGSVSGTPMELAAANCGIQYRCRHLRAVRQQEDFANERQRVLPRGFAKPHRCRAVANL